jgi:CheY-like chemotaxis protein
MMHHPVEEGKKMPSLTILLVEDDEDDAILLQNAFEREGIKRIVRNGVQCIQYLEGEGDYADRESSPFPNVIFTDLKMPVMDGFDVLRWLRDHSRSFFVPAMVLTSSSDYGDIEKAYRLGANAYLVKPNSLPDLQKFIRTAHDFWKNCAKPTLRLSS